MACFRFQESALYWRSVVCCGGFFVVLSIVGCPEKYCRRNVEVHGFSPSLPLARKKQLLTLFEMEEGLRRWFHSVTHGNLSRIYLDRYCAPWRDHTQIVDACWTKIAWTTAGFALGVFDRLPRDEVIDAEFQQNSLLYLLKKILLLEIL